MMGRGTRVRMGRIMCLLGAAIMLASYVPIPVFALKKEHLQNFAQNDIEFYDPDADNCNYDGGECHGPAGSEVTWVGDSYSVMAVDLIEEKLPGVDLGEKNEGNALSPYSYIQGSKHLDWISNGDQGGPSGMDILRSIKDDLRSVVVVALGANDKVTDEQMTETLTQLAEIVGEERKVVLVTAYTKGGGGYEGNNEAKKKFADAHENFYIADWAKVARDEFFMTDSIHPVDGDGFKTWVETIINALPQICNESSTNSIVKIDGTEYTFPLLGATKENYLNPGGKVESELSKLPCDSSEEGACHHDYFAVDLGLNKLQVDGQAMTENDFPDLKGKYSEMYYYSTGVKVVAFVGGTISNYEYYTNNVPDGYSSKCASVVFNGDDGRMYWLGHMAYDATVHAGTHFNVGDVIGEVGPPPCAQGTQSHLHIDTQPEHEYFIVDLMNKLYDSLPESGAPNTSYATRKASSSSVFHGSKKTFGGDDLPQETIEYLDSFKTSEGYTIKEAVEKNMERYSYAEKETGVPWQALAALHFREAGLRPNASLSNGEELYEHVNVDGFQIGSDANQDAVAAANTLKGGAKEVYGVDLSASSSIDDWGKAFLAYNRGYMYKVANRTWDESPYVANGMDKDHLNMSWIYADSFYNGVQVNNVYGKQDGNLAGALAVMKYLGGELGGGVSVCRNPNQYASGGLSEEQANGMKEYYETHDLSDVVLPLGTKWNCVSLTAWFVQKFTSIGKVDRAWGNGKEVVEGLRRDYQLETGTEPRPFAVFSVSFGSIGATTSFGHTGIVLGVNGNDVTIIEANYGQIGAVVRHVDKSSFYNEEYGDTFAYLDSIMDQEKLNDFVADLGL